MKSFTLSLAQLNFTIGDFSGNIALMTAAARQAAAAGARLVVFSELALTGYPPGDLLDEAGFLARADAALAAMLGASRVTPGLYWVAGAPTRRQGRARRWKTVSLCSGMAKSSSLMPNSCYRPTTCSMNTAISNRERMWREYWKSMGRSSVFSRKLRPWIASSLRSGE
ncbi:MAG: hypothetical protein LBF93_01770 [Zoogloeaceae bacterium]|nr:hypothetical protein [Zoogloeaceae bacterium]